MPQQRTRLSKEERARVALAQARKSLMLAWIGTLLLMSFMLPMWLSNYMIGGHIFSTFALFIVSGFIVFVPGNNVLKSAWVSVKNINPNMHVLTMLGTLAALATGVMNILYVFDLFPEIGNFSGLGGMIMAFHLTGSYIEQKLKHKSSDAIKALISLSPQQATVIRNKQELTISITELEIDDVALVKSGEKIPSDGIIVEGSSEIDESLVTGESVPVFKETGSPVIGGSINIDGRLKVKIEKVGSQTFLRQVIKMVEMAQGSKPQIQQIADKVISIFVPVILLISIITFLGWMFFYKELFEFLHINMSTHPFTSAIYASIAVLVIACPCALGLATPSAIAIGVGRGAQLGALIKNASIFESLKTADSIVMDKTGTITEGNPSIVAKYTHPDFEEKDMFYNAALIEKNSHHPLAKAVVKYYNDNYNQNNIPLPEPDEFKTLSGKGLVGTVNNNEIYVVNDKFLKDSNYKVSKDIQGHIDEFISLGYTIGIIIYNNNIMGLLGFIDEPRMDSNDAIKALHKMNLEVTMLTGDHKAAAEKIAQRVNIDNIIAQATPETKMTTIQKLQSKGHKVVMVGDGINDAPALTQAHIGVAMGTGTDVAAEAGDIILLKGTLPVLVSALQLSKKTYRIITQNLFWAFIYNLILIPPATLGLVHPLYAEIAMGISSITVLLNSIRISKFSPKV